MSSINFFMRTVNPFDRKRTNGFRGKENETNISSLSQFTDAPQPTSNFFGFYILLPIHFEMHDLTFLKKVGILIVFFASD